VRERDRPASSRRAALVAAAVTAAVLGGLGFGLYRLVGSLKDWQPSGETVAQPPPTPAVEPSPWTRLRRALEPDAPPTNPDAGGATDPKSPYAKTRVSGRVFEAGTGAGIYGASVRVRPSFGEPRLGPPDGDGSLSFQTGPNGYYDLVGIPPGSFDLEVRAAGFMPGFGGFRKFSAVEDDDGFDFELQPASVVEGVVRTADGRPVVGAEVVVLPERSAVLVSERSSSARTDSEGRFVLDPTPIGRIVLLVTHPRHPPTTAPVPESASPQRRVEVVIPAGGRVRGLVLGPDGPVADARIETGFLHTEHQGVAMTGASPGLSTRSGPDGRFELAMPAPGRVRLSISARGYRTERRSVAIPSPERPVAELEVRLEPGRELPGRLRRPDGRPAVGAEIVAGVPGAGFASTTTDDTGAFHVDGLPADGPWLIRARHHDHPSLERELEVLPGFLELTLDPAGKILGQVVDAASGTPIVEYHYRVDGPVRLRNQAVSTSGSIEIEQLPPGTYRLELRAEGYAPLRVDGVGVGLGETVSGLRFAMRRGGVVDGVVTGAPPGAEILIQAQRTADQGFENGALVDEDGTFHVDNLPAGDYELVAVSPGMRGRAGPVHVAEGAVVTGVRVELVAEARGP
jgi:hypothetical protein